MNRQRGVIDTLILYLIMAGFGVVLLAWGNNKLKHYYVDPEQVNWNREKASLLSTQRSYETDLNTCKAANKSLDADYTAFREKKNREVDDAKAETAAAKARREAANKANAPRMQQNSMELFNMIVELGKPAGGLSCDQLDVMLLEESKRRQKFYGPADPVQQPQPASGGLRLAEPPATQPERRPVLNPLVRPK